MASDTSIFESCPVAQECREFLDAMSKKYPTTRIFVMVRDDYDDDPDQCMVAALVSDQFDDWDLADAMHFSTCYAVDQKMIAIPGYLPPEMIH